MKRLESGSKGSLVYPFCVRQSGVSYASASVSDEEEARCEMWLPLWERPTSLTELRAIFSEGRAQVEGRTARHGVDFARACVSLGVDRGISAFQRYGFQIRNGLAYFAIPLDRVAVKRNAQADLLSDLEAWYDKLRSKVGDAPASVTTALTNVERQILAFCRNDSPDSLQAMLVSLGRAERALARSHGWASEAFVPPLSGLRAGWLKCPPSPEFRLARSLAGMWMWLGAGEGKGTFGLRQQLEAVRVNTGTERSWTLWDKTPGNDIAWREGDLTESLNAVLARRILRVQNAGVEGWPERSRHCWARLDDISAFIERRTDDALIADLLWGLSLIDWQAVVHQRKQERAAADGDEASFPSTVPSSFYGMLKLCFRPEGDNWPTIPVVPAIHQRARAGDGLAASRLAARRLLGSGEAPLVRELDVSAEAARRTAAALLFPIGERDIKLLIKALQHEPENQTA